MCDEWRGPVGVEPRINASTARNGQILEAAGESRVHPGYADARALAPHVPAPRRSWPTRCVRSSRTSRDRVAQVTAVPAKREALGRVLTEAGPPLRIAQAYAAEQTMERSGGNRRIVPIAEAIFHVARPASQASPRRSACSRAI